MIQRDKFNDLIAVISNIVTTHHDIISNPSSDLLFVLPSSGAHYL